MLLSLLSLSCPYLIDVKNHTYQILTKGLYIPCKVSLHSVYTLTVFKGVYKKEGKVYYHAQQSKVQTITRQNTSSATQKVRGLSLSG